MRLLVIAILIGASGGLFAFMQFQAKHAGMQETFRDPIERIKDRLAARGQSVVDPREVPRPKILAENGVQFNFGKMSRKAEKSHTFVLKNIGNAPSKVELVGSSCKCTVGKLSKNKLEPGESIDVTLTWNANTDQHEFGQSAKLLTDDPAFPEIQLTISGLVEEQVFLDPEAFALGDISSTESVTRKFFVFSDYETPLEIKAFRVTEESNKDRIHFQHSVRKVTPEEFPNLDSNYVAEVDVTLDAGMPTGPMYSSILIETNVDSPQVHEMQLSGRVHSQVRIIAGLNYNEEKNYISIGRVKSSEGKIIKFLVAVRDEHPSDVKLEIASIRPSESIEGRVGPANVQADQAIFPVELEVPKGAPPTFWAGTNGTNFGKILFRTNLEYSREVPVYLRVEVLDE